MSAGGRAIARAPWGRRLTVAVPYVWLALFFLAPFLVAVKISLARMVMDQPPYTPLLAWGEGLLPEIQVSLSNYIWLFQDPIYWIAYLSSLKIAAISTVGCLLIGYPMAYAIARARPGARTVLLMLVILPFWTSFLLRVYAWMGLLKQGGLVNQALMAIGATGEPLTLLHTPFAVHLGIVYAYLPFMILPLYAALAKLDTGLLEAAHDLGARPWRAFWTVTVPLSLPGVIAGSLLVFIPAVGEFVIPELLGGPRTLMIGNVLWDEFFSNRDWPVAAAVGVVLIVVLVVPIAVFQHHQGRVEGARP